MPNAAAGMNVADSAQINPGVIQTTDLADQAVDTAKLKDDDIRTGDIKDGEITNADISASAGIVDTKLATIATAGKVSGAALTSLASIPAGAGVIPAANLPGGSVVTAIPMPVLPVNAVGSRALNNPVDGRVALFNLAKGITLNKLIINVTTVGASGVIKVGIFSEDGQTRYATASSGTISATGLATITFAGESIPAGNVWIAWVSVGSANITVSNYTPIGTINALRDVTSEPTLMGTLTFTSGTIPSTLTLASISGEDVDAFVVRMDT